MGYISFNEVDLSTYSYHTTYRRKQITDFDVLGVRFEQDLSSMIAVAECKSVEDRAMENLLKLHGVQDFFGAQRAYFVQQRIDVNARDVGSRMGIVCLDADNLSSLMASLGIREDVEVALEARIYAARTGMGKEQKETFPKQTEYLKYDFWTLPDNRNIINIVRLLSVMKKEADKRPSHVVLLHQLTAALAMATLKLTGSVVRYNISDFQDGLLTALLGGSRERRDREALHDAVAKVVPDGGLPMVPDFFGPLSELATRYVNAMQYSWQVVACLDAMGRRILEPSLAKETLSKDFSERTIKLSRDAIHFAAEVGGVSKELFAQSLAD
jgi:hypothetical protein